MKPIFILLLAVLLINPLYSNKIWSLEDCINHALTHNIEIRLQLLDEKEASYELKQSYGNFLPDLNADASHGYSFGRSVDPITNEFSTERIMRQNAGASSSVTLFAGFRNVNNLRYNLLRTTALRHDTEKLKNEIILTIAAAYMQILYSEDFVATANQQLEIIGQQLERTRALFQGGTIPRGNVLELEARLAEEELNLITAKNNLRLAYLELIQILDLDPADTFTVQRPETDITDQFVALDPTEVFEKALLVQPSIKSAEFQVMMAEKQIALDRGRLSPSLSLTANMGTGYSEASLMRVLVDGSDPIFEPIPYRYQIRDNFRQYIGLSLRVPIFNSWEVRTRISRSRVDMERAQNQFQLTRNNLNKAIQQAHADASAAWQKHQATIKSLDAFEESFSYTQQRFDLGMVSSVEFNESQTRMATAEREVLQAKYDFIFKMKIMEFYMGEGFKL